ncbi:hypothetical protein [uncultured Roseobacter sp.]|uniref:hypothetical protein n=1 Tax=uncultured Roseobacter sp. TaxID=114847 RepID=UPI00260FA56A|nr:hypothetical protein [uncultured Roseobacter sp.]
MTVDKARLERARKMAANLTLLNGAFAPIFDRLDEEYQALNSSPLERARRVLAEEQRRGLQ